MLKAGVLELCAGVGTLSLACKHHGLPILCLAKSDERKRRLLHELFPDAILAKDAATINFGALLPSSDVIAVIGCPLVRWWRTAGFNSGSATHEHLC